jgi:hypothetical protein
MREEREYLSSMISSDLVMKDPRRWKSGLSLNRMCGSEISPLGMEGFHLDGKQELVVGIRNQNLTRTLIQTAMSRTTTTMRSNKPQQMRSKHTNSKLDQVAWVTKPTITKGNKQPKARMLPIALKEPLRLMRKGL